MGRSATFAVPKIIPQGEDCCAWQWRTLKVCCAWQWGTERCLLCLTEGQRPRFAVCYWGTVCMSARVCVVVHRWLRTVPCLPQNVSVVCTERGLVCLTVGHRARFAVSEYLIVAYRARSAVRDSGLQSKVCCVWQWVTERGFLCLTIGYRARFRCLTLGHRSRLAVSDVGEHGDLPNSAIYDFRPVSRFILEMMLDRAIVAMESESNHTQPLSSYPFEWPPVTYNPDFKVTILFNVK